jgi:glycolate oxidase iron-sulfur subunit
MKDYGRLLGTAGAEAFSARVRDIHEWLAERVDDLPAGRLDGRVAMQDPCHLRHAQGVHGAVRRVLARYVDVAELDDDGLCCGAGGAYAAQHPGLAQAIRLRKVAAVRRAGVTIVASANPGCILHLSAAGLDVRHPVVLVADAINGARRSQKEQ